MDFTEEVEKYSEGEHDRREILTWMMTRNNDFEFMLSELFRYTNISNEYDDFVEDKMESLIKYAKGINKVALHNMGTSNYENLVKFIRDKMDGRVPPIEWLGIYDQQDKKPKKKKQRGKRKRRRKMLK